MAESISKTKDSLAGSYKAREIESEVREKWALMDLRQRVQQKFSERKVKPLGYVDGPPTLNGEPHMGHLRGRVIKDLWFRFETLRGKNIDFRGGWDCQGLPVELQAEKELGLTGNKTNNLKAIGEESLVAACKKMVVSYHSIWKASDEK
ncbi:MAG: class I tRNA ligase family protein, partial [Thaumarchaeota archaeon]|nr:class I tRNA ligase family protein [Nitrososphaerota archaeon]